ncbi:hypothetical protein WA158_007925 [Blastocystis sp. Blastoise]
MSESTKSKVEKLPVLPFKLLLSDKSSLHMYSDVELKELHDKLKYLQQISVTRRQIADQNTKYFESIFKGPKLRTPSHLKGKQNVQIFLDSIYSYVIETSSECKNENNDKVTVKIVTKEPKIDYSKPQSISSSLYQSSGTQDYLVSSSRGMIPARYGSIESQLSLFDGSPQDPASSSLLPYKSPSLGPSFAISPSISPSPSLSSLSYKSIIPNLSIKENIINSNKNIYKESSLSQSGSSVKFEKHTIINKKKTQTFMDRSMRAYSSHNVYPKSNEYKPHMYIRPEDQQKLEALYKEIDDIYGYINYTGIKLFVTNEQDYLNDSVFRIPPIDIKEENTINKEKVIQPQNTKSLYTLSHVNTALLTPLDIQSIRQEKQIEEHNRYIQSSMENTNASSNSIEHSPRVYEDSEEEVEDLFAICNESTNDIEEKVSTISDSVSHGLKDKSSHRIKKERHSDIHVKEETRSQYSTRNSTRNTISPLPLPLSPTSPSSPQDPIPYIHNILAFLPPPTPKDNIHPLAHLSPAEIEATEKKLDDLSKQRGLYNKNSNVMNYLENQGIVPISKEMYTDETDEICVIIRQQQKHLFEVYQKLRSLYMRYKDKFLKAYERDRDLFQPCQCQNDCHEGCSCCELSGDSFSGPAYNDNHRLYMCETNSTIQELLENRMIFECSDECTCNKSCCRNFVTSQSETNQSLVQLHFFGKKGWGLISTQKIQKGTYIGEYIGEVLGNQYIVQREEETEQYKNTYLFEFIENYNNINIHYIIDARHKGNIYRFLNHSCDPNLTIRIIRRGTYLPHICFFAQRYIEEGEELCFHYNPSSLSVNTDVRNIHGNYEDNEDDNKENNEDDNEDDNKDDNKDNNKNNNKDNNKDNNNENHKENQYNTPCLCGSVNCCGYLPSTIHN